MSSIINSHSKSNLERELIPQPFTSAQEYISELLLFLREWSRFFQYTSTTVRFSDDHTKEEEEEDHVILFFKNKHFEQRVPQEWQLLFSNNDQVDDNDETCKHLIEMTRDGKVREHWPNSLKNFVTKAKSLYLRRAPSTHNTNNTLPSDESTKESAVVNNALNYNKREMIRGMSPKKQHEVHTLAHLIAKYASSTAVETTNTTTSDTNSQACDSVLDIGSGKGYLSHVLAFDYGLNVLAVDHNENVVQKSMEKSHRLLKGTTNQSNDVKNTSRPNAVSYKAISSHLTTDQTDFEELMSRMDNIPRDSNLCLIGLHTCGDLAPAMIKLFLAHDRARCMVNVGCCYHKVTESCDVNQHQSCCGGNVSGDNDTSSYPMSQFVRDQGGLLLTNGGKVLACAALDKWSAETQALNNFKRNAHRCALEAFLHEYQGSPNQSLSNNASSAVYCIGSISDQYSSFVSYAMQSIRTLKNKNLIVERSKLNELLANEDVLSEELNRFYQSLNPRKDERITQLDVYWSLRALLGPLLEALIIVDRFLFLKEQGVEADVMRIFDGELSPRNMVLLAKKYNVNE